MTPARVALAATGPRARLVLLAVAGLAAASLVVVAPALQRRVQNDPAAFLPDGAESTAVLRALQSDFPGAGTSGALVVWRRAGGLTVDDQAAIQGTVEDVRADRPPALALLVAPWSETGRRIGLVSEDGSVAVAVAVLAERGLPELQEPIADLRAAAAAGAPAGVETHVTGTAAIGADAQDILDEVHGPLLAATVLLLLVLVLVVYRAPLVAVVPLVCVLASYAIALAGLVLLIETTSLEVNGQAIGILIALMFGAGVDACLLALARYREELRAEGEHPLRRALLGVSPAIAGSGTTVAVAMLVLMVGEVQSTRSLGPVLALGAASTLIAALVFLPAMLATIGPRAFWPQGPRAGHAAPWRWLARTVERRPALCLTASLAVLGIAALGNLASLQPLAFAQGFRNDPDSVQGAQALATALPAGELSPADVVVTVGSPDQRAAAVAAVAQALAATPGVARVREAPPGDEGRGGHLLVSGEADPWSRQALEEVPELRAVASSAAPTGATAAVGGTTAQLFDVVEAVGDDLWKIVPLTLALVALVLAWVLRSWVAPLYVIASMLASFAATLGLVTVILHALGAPGVEPSLSTFVFLFTVALGVDYTIFLLSRAREERDRGVPASHAAAVALERTGGVITSAGFVLAGTFMVLAILPHWSLLEIGLGVGLGVLVDVMLVRTLLVPSLAVLLGERGWTGRRGARSA